MDWHRKQACDLCLCVQFFCLFLVHFVREECELCVLASCAVFLWCYVFSLELKKKKKNSENYQKSTVIAEMLKCVKISYSGVHELSYAISKFSYCEGDVTYIGIRSHKIPYFQPKAWNIRNQIAYENFCDNSWKIVFLPACECVTMKKSARQMASTTSDTGDTSSSSKHNEKKKYKSKCVCVSVSVPVCPCVSFSVCVRNAVFFSFFCVLSIDLLPNWSCSDLISTVVFAQIVRKGLYIYTYN